MRLARDSTSALNWLALALVAGAAIAGGIMLNRGYHLAWYEWSLMGGILCGAAASLVGPHRARLASLLTGLSVVQSLAGMLGVVGALLQIG